jgi:predicted dienelactone hydrolase
MRTLPLLFPLFALACTGANDDTDTEPTPEDIVLAPGPFAVGFETTSLTYARLGTGEDRTLPVQVWYPAVDGGEPAATYSVAGVVDLPSTGALDGPDPDVDGAPLALYSHGSGGLGLLAYPYAEHLASHGWVVVAFDHVGNTSLDFLGSSDSLVRSAIDRPVDVETVLDALEDGTLAPEVTTGVDVQQTLVFGHSFGGYTTFAAPRTPVEIDLLDCTGADCDLLTAPDVVARYESPSPDGRIRALSPQAPAFAGLFSPATLSGLDVPVLLTSAAGDITTPDPVTAQVFWDGMEGADDRWLRIPDGGHYSFISICEDIAPAQLALFAAGSENDGCGPDSAPIPETLDGLAAYTLAFGELHVRGDTRFEAIFAPDAPSLSEWMRLEQP